MEGKDHEKGIKVVVGHFKGETKKRITQEQSYSYCLNPILQCLHPLFITVIYLYNSHTIQWLIPQLPYNDYIL